MSPEMPFIVIDGICVTTRTRSRGSHFAFNFRVEFPEDRLHVYNHATSIDDKRVAIFSYKWLNDTQVVSLDTAMRFMVKYMEIRNIKKETAYRILRKVYGMHSHTNPRFIDSLVEETYQQKITPCKSTIATYQQKNIAREPKMTIWKKLTHKIKSFLFRNK